MSPPAPEMAARSSETATVPAAPAGSPTPSATSAPARRERMAFVDGLRGLALIVMVVNHTGHWWIDVSMGWPRYHLVYMTVTIAAPIFLFLVGFSLAISFANAGIGSGRRVPVVKYVRRALGVVAGGYLLNVVTDDPLWSWGVLQTIGTSIILLSPVGAVIARRATRVALVAVAVALYVSFSLSYPAIKAWLPGHPFASAWFGDFPLWPWIGMAMIGLALGWSWMETSVQGPAARARFMGLVALAGVSSAAYYLAFDALVGTSPRLAFTRDFLINRHWTPRGATAAWVLGVVGVSLALMYYVMEVRKLRLAWLVTLGQASLMLYFVHQVIVFRLVKQLLGVEFHTWWPYALANAALIVVCVYLGRAWIAIKRYTSSRGA